MVCYSTSQWIKQLIIWLGLVQSRRQILLSRSSVNQSVNQSVDLSMLPQRSYWTDNGKLGIMAAQARYLGCSMSINKPSQISVDWKSVHFVWRQNQTLTVMHWIIYQNGVSIELTQDYEHYQICMMIPFFSGVHLVFSGVGISWSNSAPKRPLI